MSSSSKTTATPPITTILEFVSELKKVYPSDKPIALYHALLERNYKKNEIVLVQHRLFKDFLFQNENALKTRDTTKLVQNKIQWKETVYLEIKKYLEDPDVCSTVWQYLLALNMLFFPSKTSKELYTQTLPLTKQIGQEGTKEGELFDQVFDQVQTLHITSEDPQAVMSQLFAGGVVGDLLGKVKTGIVSGDLNAKNLIKMAQGILNSVSAQIEKEEHETNPTKVPSIEMKELD
jgi:hypothetical protein